MIDLRLALPTALLLLLTLPLLVLLARWRLAPLPRHVRLTAIGLRLLIVVLVILATAGPRLTSAADTLTLVVVADRSDSVLPAAAQLDQALAALRQRAGARDQIGLVEFGRDAVVLQAPGGEAVVPAPRTSGDASNLEQALRVAAGLFPPTGSHRVLLLTDGRETDGDAAAAAASLAAAGIEIDVLPLAPGMASGEGAQRSGGALQGANVLDVAIDRLEAPSDVREGDALDVTIVVHSTVDTTTRLEVWVDEQSVLDQPVELGAGETRVPLPLRAVGEGFHSFRARVTTEGDAYPQNNELSATTVVHPRAKVLLVSEQPATAPLRTALIEAGADVTPLDPAALPVQALALRDFDVVVLNNLPASVFNEGQMRALGEYVEQLGKGLIVVGGEQAFSLGEYAGTPLEDALPVKARPPSREQRPTVALLLIIDKSGSMALGSGRTSKMAMARQAAVLATQALDDEDQVGVLAFDDSNTWAVPFQKLGDRANRAAIEARIGQIDASGGTEIAPALAEGLPAIVSAQAGVKHVVLLTDGQSVSPRRRYDQILDRFRRERITLSTIAVGKDSDQELLKRLAEQGRGRYYYTETPDDIPRLVMGEARMVSSPAYVVGNFQPRVTNAGPILQAIDPASLPQLGGYAVTIAKPQADVVLVSPRDDPILVGWQYGLGRSLAFTSGLERTWGNEWLAWDGIGRFLSGAMRWVAARPGGENLDTSAVASDGRATVRVTSVHDDGSFGDLLTTEAEIAGPTAETRMRVPLRQIGPGTYEAAVDTPVQGAYALRITQREGDAVLYQQLSGFVVGYPAEYRPGPPNLPLLETLAARTGGRVLSDPAEALRREGPARGRETHELWWPLLALALVLFPLDIAVRRFRWEWPARLRLGRQT